MDQYPVHVINTWLSLCRCGLECGEKVMGCLNVDGEPLIIKGLVSPTMTLLHSFLHCEMVLFSRETVVCIFNSIFPGCELVSTIA